MNGHPRDQANVSVHCRWPLIRGTDGQVEMSRNIDNVSVHSRWPLTTGVAQGRYYCTTIMCLPKLAWLPYRSEHRTSFLPSYLSSLLSSPFNLLPPLLAISSYLCISLLNYPSLPLSSQINLILHLSLRISILPIILEGVVECVCKRTYLEHYSISNTETMPRLEK